jgi:phosphoribosylcarboxyaminoimidazole (NCAIR) mutase
MAIGNAVNAALFAARILALDDEALSRSLHERTAKSAAEVESLRL